MPDHASSDPLQRGPHASGTFPRAGPDAGSRSALPRFGAHCDGSGTRFRLWAPAARSVGVELINGLDGDPGHGANVLEMTSVGRGWYERHCPDVAHGQLYLYRIDGEARVPDPASRFQPAGVSGPSQVVDPERFTWSTTNWTGRPWHEAVIYELHVGTFSPSGTFRGVRERLAELVRLGVTTLQLMPVGAFAGARGWGYDGVLPFAPHHPYGSPDELKRLVDQAHALGMMVLLDVVYNHFGPEGNHLPRYAPQFFTSRFETPWGAAIDFEQPQVRHFFLSNALYWLQEYRMDGLRVDAAHAMRDSSPRHILHELAEEVRRRQRPGRELHLVLENGRNEARYLERDPGGHPRLYTAQWNDDIHHALHVLATGESDGYYQPFSEDPAKHLGRCLAEGFAFQGECFSHWRGRPRGELSRHLSPLAFIAFLQNHDQVGNRAMGTRIAELAPAHVLDALIPLVILAPSPPLLFMGEEWGAHQPFPFFCDFPEELAQSVREGRRREFQQFQAFRTPEALARIPDPNAEDTFRSAVLDRRFREHSDHQERLRLYRRLLLLRKRDVIPRLQGVPGRGARWRRLGSDGLRVDWVLGDGSGLTVLTNLSDQANARRTGPIHGRLLHGTHPEEEPGVQGAPLPPWSTFWYLNPARDEPRGQTPPAGGTSTSSTAF